MWIENLLAASPGSAERWFYRTSAGAEIDLLIQVASGERWRIEVKRSSGPERLARVRSGCDDVGATRRLVVYPGEKSFPLPGDAEAVSLLDAVRHLREAGGPARNDVSGAGDA